MTWRRGRNVTCTSQVAVSRVVASEFERRRLRLVAEEQEEDPGVRRVVRRREGVRPVDEEEGNASSAAAAAALGSEKRTRFFEARLGVAGPLAAREEERVRRLSEGWCSSWDGGAREARRPRLRASGRSSVMLRLGRSDCCAVSVSAEGYSKSSIYVRCWRVRTGSVERWIEKGPKREEAQ